MPTTFRKPGTLKHKLHPCWAPTLLALLKKVVPNTINAMNKGLWYLARTVFNSLHKGLDCSQLCSFGEGELGDGPESLLCNDEELFFYLLFRGVSLSIVHPIRLEN